MEVSLIQMSSLISAYRVELKDNYHHPIHLSIMG